MRALCLAVTFGFALSLIPLRLPAQPAEKDFARWRTELQKREERLRRQDWKAVAKGSRELTEQMVDRVLVGEASGAMLALALVQQAVAESALGHREEAVWLLHLAQNLDARFRGVTLGSYGPAGAELERFQLRQLGQAPAAWPKLPDAGSYQPPRAFRQKEPRTPDALARALVAADVEVEIGIGPDGQIVEPVLVTQPEYPSLAFVILESLRGWQFAPAHASGATVPALVRMRISHEKLRKTVEGASSNQRGAAFLRVAEMRLESFDARLRQGEEGQAVHAAVQELVDRLRETGSEIGLLPMALRVLALAEARIGRGEEAVWHWQVAQNLQPGLMLDPAAYGEAGALLARHGLRRRDEAPDGIAAVAVTALGAGSTPPRKIAGDEPKIPGFLTLPGAPRWGRLQAVIDTQGRVVEPVVVAGRSEAFRWAALEAVRSWRFEPARREGQPVAVLLDIDLPLRTETPLAEMVPLTGKAGSVHALLLRQDWEKARAEAAALVKAEAEEPEADPRRSAAAVALLALADAGSRGPFSTCYWHAAHGLYEDLYHASLAAYGTAGALLEASNPWMLNEEIRRYEAPSRGEAISRPEKIGGGPPEYPARDRKARISGNIITDIVIDEDGRVTHPRVLQGLSPGLDLNTLITLCEWRFKPATLSGRPIDVYYAVTINFKVF